MYLYLKERTVYITQLIYLYLPRYDPKAVFELFEAKNLRIYFQNYNYIW